MSYRIHILALCATYNRRNVTLAALRSIRTQTLYSKVTIDFAVVDDASSDGTLIAVKNEFPDILSIDSGGGMFWAGAMRFGFRLFWQTHKYTHLLVFNDDVVLYPDSINQLINTAELFDNEFGVVAVGAMRDSKTGALTYGGLKRRSYHPSIYLTRIKPSAEFQFVDTLNMNLALISRTCLDRNEFILNGFTHSLADFDFGLRASKNKAKIVVAPNFLGECSRNHSSGTWEDANLSFSKRWALILSPKGLPLYPRFIYLKSHAPYIWPLIFIWPYVRLTLSHFFKLLKPRVCITKR